MSLQHAYQFEAIGTHWSIETIKTLSQVEIRHIHTIIDDFDSVYSRFRADSLVSRARSEAPGSFKFPDNIALLYDTYIQLEKTTNGAVNPLVGATLEHLGYDAAYSLRPVEATVPKPLSLAKTIERNGTMLAYNRPVLLDIGAIGKGYLVDQVATYLAKQHGQYIVDAGGDLAVATDQPYIIGLENPQNLDQVIGTLSLQHGSICGSAPNRRKWGEKLHHIIDARTGKPAESDIVATWAIADTTMLADALATALFFTSADVLHQQFGDFSYIIMRANSHLEHNITKKEEIQL
jgi:thiamine biosynthesis lipoprotein